MFGRKSNSNLTFIVIALASLLIGFNFLGPIGGVAVLAVLIGWMFYRRRSTTFYRMARKRFEEGDMEGAKDQLRKSVGADPMNAIVLTSCGFMLLKMGNPIEAERLLTRAVNSAKTPEEKYNAQSIMSLLLWKKGQLDDAVTMLESVMENYKTTATYSTMGFYLIEQGNAERALTFNREAYEFNDKNAVILDNYGSALLMSGDRDEAIKIYEELIKLNPTFPDAWFNYGRLLETMGQDQEALRMYQEASRKKFWYTSTITRDEVEYRLQELEEKLGLSSDEQEEKLGLSSDEQEEKLGLSTVNQKEKLSLSSDESDIEPALENDADGAAE